MFHQKRELAARGSAIVLVALATLALSPPSSAAEALGYDGPEPDPQVASDEAEAFFAEHAAQWSLDNAADPAEVRTLAANVKKNPNPYTTKVPPLVRDTEKYGKPNSCAGHRFEKHQYARACYRIAQTGRVVVWSKFTNNKRWDGDHFAAVFAFRDERGKLVFWTRHAAGINAENVGGPGDVYRRSKGIIAPGDVAKIRSVTVKWARPNVVNDREAWKKAGELLCEIFDCKGGDDDYADKELN